MAPDVRDAWRYHRSMIRSFRDCGTQGIFAREPSRRLSPRVQHLVLRKLLMLDAAEATRDVTLAPGNRLEKSIGGPECRYSIRANDRWRVRFRWIRGSVHEVEIVDLE